VLATSLQQTAINPNAEKNRQMHLGQSEVCNSNVPQCMGHSHIY